MKRPILVAVIGYIIGIIIGLYFNFSIVFFYLLAIPIAVFIKSIKIRKKKFSFYSISRYLRYFKLVLDRKVIITIIIFSCLSNFIIREKNKKYNDFYNTSESVEIVAKVTSEAQEKEYKNTYKIKVLEINKYKKDINLYLNIDNKKDLKYGDIIKIKGKYKAPDIQRNYGGFSYREYLKTLNIYGNVTAERIEVIEKSKRNDISFFIHQIKENVKLNAKKYLDEETYSIYLGLILGDTSYIEDDTKEKFRNSNMSHILAVSGMHITYIVLGIVLFLSKLSGKKIAKILSIIVLVFYITITGFSPSIIRACSTAIIMLVGGIINRKSDVWTSMSISLFIILIHNPFLITNIGLQFSYMGTLGIIILNKNVMKILTSKKNTDKHKIRKFKIHKTKFNEKFISKFKEIIAVSISAQIFILPLTIFHFNTIGLYFLITNLLLSLIIGPVIILGFLFLTMLILNLSILNIFAFPIKWGIKIILFITQIGNFPYSKIYVATPKVFVLIIYFVFVMVLNHIYTACTNKSPTNSNLRVKYMLQLLKYNIRKYSKKIISFVILIIFLSIFVVLFIPKSLKIHFVDVGQGDCCFIETPGNKTILIDGGGSEFGSYDVGKNTLLPYILDRGYTKIDYIFISHFDTDHVQGLLTILKELQVENVIIAKQKEESQNYKKFIEIVNSGKLKVDIVKKGDRVKIEDDLYFDIIWPNTQNLINENALNNNSMMCKLIYKDFSMVFTGDIEEIAEKKILQEYKNNLRMLNSTILKIAHHGSKTSSMQEFLEAVKPKIVLIGVGESNKFGHPNKEVLERLELLRFKNL